MAAEDSILRACPAAAEGPTALGRSVGDHPQIPLKQPPFLTKILPYPQFDGFKREMDPENAECIIQTLEDDHAGRGADARHADTEGR